MNIQILKGADGKAAFAVLPIEEFNRIAQGRAEIDDEGEVWQSVPYEAAESDDAVLPQEVAELMFEGKSCAAAWRIYRGLTQKQAASYAGITQAALSQIEQPGNRLQDKTREMLADVYRCSPAQLSV